MPSIRHGKLLYEIDIEASAGLEIGALCWPVVPDDKANIRYADHLSTTDLQTKYADDPLVAAESIVHVDYVCRGTPLSLAVGKVNCFDFVIASHVIEHVPDVIGWLMDIWTLLKPGGVVCLAIPDQRFTFDCNRSPTGVAVLIEDHLLRRQAPSPRAVFDHIAHHANLARSPPGPTYTLVDALGLARDALANYHDVHCLVVTPALFLSLLEPLFELDLLHYRIRSFFDTAAGENEFFIQLEKIAVPPAERRRQQKESLEYFRRRLNPRKSQVNPLDSEPTDRCFASAYFIE